MAEPMVVARRAVKLVLLVGVAFVLWKATFGDSVSPRLRALDAEVRLLHHRLEVFKYWDVKGALPECLDDTMTIRGASPVSEWNRYSRERGKQCVDPWDEALGWTRDADGAGFEIRSHGPDRKAGTPDDLVLRGNARDDRKAAYEEFKVKSDEYERLRPKSRKRRPY
jgi:hypothetical protein